MTQNPLEKIAGDLDAAYERLSLGIEYLRSTPEPDWQDVLAHLKLARQCLGRDPGDRLRAQAEAEAGLREAVAQLMSDPWSYHEKGARCIDCGRLDVDGHSDDCAVVKIRVFIAQDELRAALAQAGGES